MVEGDSLRARRFPLDQVHGDSTRLILTEMERWMWSRAILKAALLACCWEDKLENGLCTKCKYHPREWVDGSDHFYQARSGVRSIIPPTAVGGLFRWFLQRGVNSKLRAQRGGGKRSLEVERI